MPVHSLRTLGGLSLLNDGATLEGPSAQRKRLILLALVATYNQGAGMSRDRLVGLLWPESDEQRARNSLNQSLYGVRRDLGEDAVTGAADLRIDSTLLECDLVELWRANERHDAASVVSRYGGPFLDGVFITGAAELNAWIERMRSSVEETYRGALLTLARQSEADGAPEIAVEYWRRLAAVTPLDASVACSLMRALVANHDRSGAVAHARVYTTMVRNELDMDPDASVTTLAEQLACASDMTASSTPHRRERDAAIEVPTRVQRELPRPLARPTVNERDPVALRLRTPGMRALFEASRSRRIAGVVAVLLILVYAGVRLSQQRSTTTAGNGQSREPVVFPFQAHIADSSLAFLGEGIADLLIATMAQRGGVVPPDAHSLASAWKAASAESADRATIAVRAIERVGANSAILGTVVGNRTLINVSAQIIGRDGRLVGAMARTSGSPDSILGIVDRLASALLAGEATQDARGLADLTTRSPEALRDYLRALSAMRSGDRDTAVTAFRAALHRDSSFALAALGIAAAGGWADVSVAERLKHDFRLGWTLRLALAPPERRLFDAAVGLYDPTEDSDAANLERWARAARAAPDRADVIYEYGDRLFHTGSYLRVPDADALAERAFRQAVRMDSGQIVALGHLTELALERGDLTSARDYFRAYVALDTLAAAGPYLAWRVALAAGDSATVKTLRGKFNRLPSGSLRRIAGVSQLDALPLADAESALEVLVTREQNPRERDLAVYRLHAFDMNTGKAAAGARLLDVMAAANAENVTDAPTLGDALDLAITDAVFSVGDTAQALRALARMAKGRSPSSRTMLRHACSTEVWRLEHGDTSRTVATVRRLSALRPGIDSAAHFGWQPRICISGLSAALAVARHADDAHDAVTRMDSLMATGPRGFGSTFGNLWVARLYARLGEPERAASATLRIGRDWDNVLYLADMDAAYLRVAANSRNTADYRVRDRRYRALRGRSVLRREATK